MNAGDLVSNQTRLIIHKFDTDVVIVAKWSTYLFSVIKMWRHHKKNCKCFAMQKTMLHVSANSHNSNFVKNFNNNKVRFKNSKKITYFFVPYVTTSWKMLKSDTIYNQWNLSWIFDVLPNNSVLPVLLEISLYFLYFNVSSFKFSFKYLNLCHTYKQKSGQT